jgi:hypothetical protein
MKNSAFPSHFATLEFYNGGLSIAKYQNVSMSVISMSSSSITNGISFYQYHIFDKKQNIDEFIIDSEALAFKYTIDNE